MKGKREYVKDNFYEEFATTVTGCPKNDIKILQEHFSDKRIKTHLLLRTVNCMRK
jgi:hypothetical protein